MSDVKHIQPGSDRAVALLGLLGQTGSGTGPKPSSGEIRLYLDGEVGDDRAAQIKSHIAHDPEIFASVLRIQEERDTTPSAKQDEPSATDQAIAAKVVPLKRPTKSKLLFWAGGALAASVLLTTFVFISSQTEDSSPRQRIATPTQTNQATELEAQAAYMREGYQHGQTLSGDGSQLSLAGACGDDCSSLEALLLEFGVLVRKLEGNCQQGRALSGSDLSQLQGLVQGPKALTQGPWDGYAQALLDASSRSNEAFCRAVAQLAVNLK